MDNFLARVCILYHISLVGMLHITYLYTIVAKKIKRRNKKDYDSYTQIIELRHGIPERYCINLHKGARIKNHTHRTVSHSVIIRLMWRQFCKLTRWWNVTTWHDQKICLSCFALLHMQLRWLVLRAGGQVHYWNFQIFETREKNGRFCAATSCKYIF